jgi:DNA-binding transcriptional ArsR family regulator
MFRACPRPSTSWPSRRERPRLVGELTDRLGLPQPSTSKHLKALREAGLVRVGRDGTRRWYRLCPEPLRAVDQWLAPYRRMWEGSLEALERHLDAMPDDPDDELSAKERT